jgi:hypothetical protein
MAEAITEKECGKCRTDIDGQLGRQEKRLNTHSEKIDSIEKALVVLTEIQKIMQDSQKQISSACGKQKIMWFVLAGILLLMLGIFFGAENILPLLKSVG